MSRLHLLLALSGATALTYEVLWMRRFALLFGGGAVAVTLTVATLFGGLGLGGLLGQRLRGPPARRYAQLEAGAALWALGLPWALEALTPFVRSHPGLGVQALVVLILTLPPALALGATLPVLARGIQDRSTLAGLYGANTLGAMLGVLAVPHLLLPIFGVSGSERLAVGCGLLIAALAWSLPLAAPEQVSRLREALSPQAIFAAALTGLCGMALEVAWMRLGGVLLGPSIYAFAWVLAAFLGGIAVGAALARRWTQRWVLPAAVGAMGVLALGGAFVFGQAPLLLAQLYEVFGASGMWAAELTLAVLTMAGAPVASGLAFGAALRQAGGEGGQATAAVLAANTLAGVVGSALTGLVLLPALGIQGVVTLCAVLLALGAVILGKKQGIPWLVAVALLAFLLPPWDGKLYAVGVYNRVSDLGDRSAAGVRKFAEEGWTLLSYEEGRTGSVALGRSTRTGNVWLSLNGKVDASTGDDMPTQLLSGQIPMAMAPHPERALVVGLASGVTAGAVLEFPTLTHLTLVELEPKVVQASHAFDHVNGKPLDDPRTELLVQDARAVLAQTGPDFDVIISEPSNPWITGVSNLFTVEYWLLGEGRLAPDGVFCQWIQLYGLAPTEFQSIVASFTSVFPQTWLFEPLEGGDVLLMGSTGAPKLDALPIAPTLGPEGVRALGQGGVLNTDDRPVVELAAPRSLHLATVGPNLARIEEIQARYGLE
jgi:spermidine synthase